MPTKTCPSHLLKFLQVTIFRASNKFICEGQGVSLLILFTGFSLLEPLQMWLFQCRKKQPLLYQAYPNTQTQVWEVEVMAPSENTTFSTWLIEPCMWKHSSVLHSPPGNRNLKGRKLIMSGLPFCQESYRKIARQLPFLENTFPSLKHLSHSSSTESHSEFLPLDSQKNTLRNPLQSCTEAQMRLKS